MQSAASVSPESATRPPDWQMIALDVKCPLCGYNLRGLIEPRCPECGYAFSWPDVLQPGRDLHPYLFEHHPERNVRSFFGTLLHPVIRPQQFWESINPAQRTSLKRLILYWFIYALLAVIPPALSLIAIFWVAYKEHPSYFSTQPLSRIWRYLTPGVQLGGSEACLIVLLLFPWLNFLALLIFQQSMRRAKVRPIHVLRCALYSGDLIVWFSIVASIAVAAIEPIRALRRLGNPVLALLLGGDTLMAVLWNGAGVVLLVNGLRLFIAYRHYLRTQRALSLVIASQIVVAFAVLAALWVLPQVLSGD